MAQVTQGAEHVGLAVKDIKTTAQFFTDILGFTRLGEKPDYPAIFLTDGITKITLWQVSNPENATPFNRRENIGLHHLAFKLESDAALHALYEKLKMTPNIVIEFAPELLGKGPSRHMMMHEPGGIRIEFIVRN